MWEQSCDYLVTVIIEMAQMSQAHTALRNKVGWASVCVVGHVMTDVMSKQDGQCVWAWTTQLCGKHWYTLGTHDAFLSWICGTGDDCRAVRDGRAVYHCWLMRAQIGPIQTGTADKTNDLYNEGKWDSLLQYNVFWIEPCHCKWPIYWWADHQRMFKCCRTKTHSHTHSGETNTCFCWACYS